MKRKKENRNKRKKERKKERKKDKKKKERELRKENRRKEKKKTNSHTICNEIGVNLLSTVSKLSYLFIEFSPSDEGLRKPKLFNVEFPLQ